MEPIYYKNVKEGLYLIDEDGNIWSNYKKGYMSPAKDKDGYLKVCLSGGSREDKCYVRIATLVAWTFIGPPPSFMKDPTVNHKDGNILNNNYKNLEWVERGYNSSIRNNKGAGEDNHEAKLNENQVKEICELLINTDMSFNEIATNYNVSKSVISSIKRQVSWKSITKQYDFNCRINIRDELGRFKNINTKFHPEYRESSVMSERLKELSNG